MLNQQCDNNYFTTNCNNECIPNWRLKSNVKIKIVWILFIYYILWSIRPHFLNENYNSKIISSYISHTLNDQNKNSNIKTLT